MNWNSFLPLLGTDKIYISNIGQLYTLLVTFYIVIVFLEILENIHTSNWISFGGDWTVDGLLFWRGSIDVSVVLSDGRPLLRLASTPVIFPDRQKLSAIWVWNWIKGIWFFSGTLCCPICCWYKSQLFTILILMQ